MRFPTAFLALALAAASLGGTASAQTFKDTICPEATQYVAALGHVGNADPQRAYDAVQAAVNAYAQCSKDKLSNGFREAQHYADTRAAGLAVVAARQLVTLKRYDDARRELLQWRPLAQQVVDWQSETEIGNNGAHRPGDVETDANRGANAGQPITASGSDHRPSMYRASAKEIVAAIDAELGEIAKVAPAH